MYNKYNLFINFLTIVINYTAFPEMEQEPEQLTIQNVHLNEEVVNISLTGHSVLFIRTFFINLLDLLQPGAQQY